MNWWKTREFDTPRPVVASTTPTQNQVDSLTVLPVQLGRPIYNSYRDMIVRNVEYVKKLDADTHIPYFTTKLVADLEALVASIKNTLADQQSVEPKQTHSAIGGFLAMPE